MVLLADTFAGGFEAEAFIETSARNPAIQGGEDVKLPPRTHAKQHFRALPYAEIPEFMRRLRAAASMGARAIEWTVLTASRDSMTLGARRILLLRLLDDVSDDRCSVLVGRLDQERADLRPLLLGEGDGVAGGRGVGG